MVLIIAEKPSLARNIVEGIKLLNPVSVERNTGYIRAGSYIVTWAFGHLFSLSDIETYKPLPDGVKHWSMENLPCFPETFRFELRRDADGHTDDGVVRQFRLISDLCNRSDIERIINAGDADREGEIIVRLCITHALKSEKPIDRLWLPDQTPQTVAEGLLNLRSDAEYDHLANEGYARTYIDWLYGVNLTRYATLKSGTLLRVGRVIIPIVRAIYERDMAIRHFVPDVYYAIVSHAETNGEEIELTSDRKFDKNEWEAAEAFCLRYNAKPATVTHIKRKKDKLSPGKLYSLSKLQNVLGKKYKMSMAESLELLQGLYEKGYITYPRTNTEYLATAEKSKITRIVENVKQLGYPVVLKDNKNIFDDSKIESHSALTPTYKIPRKDQLSEKEAIVYSTVFRRFAAVFCAEECLAERTEIKIVAGDNEEFTLKGIIILERGWMKYDDNTKKDKCLPALKKGDTINIAFEPVERRTAPPKHYTIETLNNYLKNPFKEERNAEVVEDDREEYRAMLEGVELGTEATRTGIIDNARKSGYIELKKDVYTILPDGEYLVEFLTMNGIAMDKFKTVEMGRSLKKVFHGESTVEESVTLARNEIEAVFAIRNTDSESDTDIGFFGDIVGRCPLCGADVQRTKRGYGCTAYRDGCKFGIFSPLCGRAVSKKHAEALLRDGQTGKINGFVSKRTGKSFDAKLRLEDGRVIFDFS